MGVYGHAMPESVKAGIAKMGELLGHDRLLELPPRREVVERPADGDSGSNGDTNGDTRGTRAPKRAKRRTA